VSPLTIRLTVFPTQLSHNPLGSWTLDHILPALDFTYKLTEPLRQFSFGRGATPFLLKVEIVAEEGASVAQISSIKILGVKIDLSDYSIVHRDGGSFTAVKTTFLAAIQSQGAESWRRYLRALSNVRTE
jgi:hypothetical protein